MFGSAGGLARQFSAVGLLSDTQPSRPVVTPDFNWDLSLCSNTAVLTSFTEEDGHGLTLSSLDVAPWAPSFDGSDIHDCITMLGVAATGFIFANDSL